MTRRLLPLAAVVAMSGVLVACSSGAAGDSEGSGDGSVVLDVAALEGGYGTDMYDQVAAAYEELNPDVTIELQTSKSIEDEITPNMKAGQYPDLVVLGQGRQAALTETLVKDRALEDLTDVLDATVPGEDVTVGDKLIDGIVGNLNTNPYGDDSTYLMPMYYSPTGLVYDQGLFEEKGWTLPTTWDELFALGDTAKAEGISLFTYPTAGYLDSYFFSLLATVGGEDFYEDVMTYQEGVWTTDEAAEAIDLTAHLLTYASPTTVGYANEQDFTKNQQQILDRTAVFMPNGTWIAGEMADAPRADGFTWGLMPLPALDDGGDRYLTTSVESAWIPSEAEHVDEAKEFLAYLYSDEAAAIFAESNAVQPIAGMTDTLAPELAGFYAQYDQPGVTALVGGFASTAPVEGVNIKSTLFDTANSIISGDKTPEQWLTDLDVASEKLRAAGE